MPKPKRLREGMFVGGVSASTWNWFVDVLEGIEGIGCRILKTETGHGWRIIVDGHNSDLPYPSGMEPLPPETISSEGLPDGLEVWGRVEYDTSGATPKIVQYKDIWNAETGEFEESAEGELITELESHSSQHE